MGSVARKRSRPGSSPGTQARPWVAFATRLAWVSTAPLGVPVVPEV